MDKDKYDWKQASNAFEAISTGRDAAVKVAKARIGTKLPYICLVLIILFDICNQFVQTGLSAFSWGLLLNVMTSVAFSVLVFYVFFPVGKNGKAGMSDAVSIYTAWKGACDKIRAAGSLCAFREYCKARGRREQDEAYLAQLEDLANMYIPREEYEGRFKKMSKKNLRRCQKNGEITKDAFSQILKMRKKIDPTQYNPTYILTTAVPAARHSVLNGKDHRQGMVLASKPAITVICGVMLDMIVVSQKEVNGWAVVIFSICLSVFKIIISAFCGYHAGYAQEAHELNIIEAKVTFIGEFSEEGEAYVHRDLKDTASTGETPGVRR